MIKENIITIFNLLAKSDPLLAKDDNINYDENIIKYLLENKILIRYTDKLIDNNIELNAYLYKRYMQEKNRVEHLEKIIYKINTLLSPFNGKFLFFKNYQHYPDMGDDLDILILGEYENIKSSLIQNLSVHEAPSTIVNKIAGKCMLISDDNTFEIELHNKKLGRLGEFDMSSISFTSMIHNKMGLNIPSIEFGFIINIIQRVYTRSHIRLSELFFYKNVIINNPNVNYNIINQLVDMYKINSGYNLYIKLLSQIDFDNTKIDDNGILKIENNILRISYFISVPLIIKRLLHCIIK